MKAPYLARMVLKDLVRLRDKVEKAIDKRVGRERVSLEGKIAQLSFLARPGTFVMGKKKPDGRKRKRGKAPIKYRGPQAGEKWSGRGLTPRWLTAYIKQGKKEESFLVGAKKR